MVHVVGRSANAIVREGRGRWKGGGKLANEEWKVRRPGRRAG